MKLIVFAGLSKTRFYSINKEFTKHLPSIDDKMMIYPYCLKLASTKEI